SYIYEDYGHEKLAVVFNAVHSPYRYSLESYDEIFKEKEYNILYINDNQFTVGSSFIKGQSDSTIETDIESLILLFMNNYNYTNDDIFIIGRSKAGFAALYYGIKNGFKNIVSITPLSIIGDYYSRHEQYDRLLKHLTNGVNKSGILYLY